MKAMKDFTILIGREHASMDLLLLYNPALGEVSRQLQDGIVFCGVRKGKCIAICLVLRKSESYEIMNWVVEPELRGQGYGRALLLYAFDYMKALGGTAADAAASNTNVGSFAALQRLGFRIIGVLRNYFKNDNAYVENGIARRDLLRYRFTL